MRTTTGSWGLHRDEMQVLCVNANENHHLLLTNPYLNTLAPLNSHIPIRIAALRQHGFLLTLENVFGSTTCAL